VQKRPVLLSPIPYPSNAVTGESQVAILLVMRGWRLEELVSVLLRVLHHAAHGIRESPAVVCTTKKNKKWKWPSQAERRARVRVTLAPDNSSLDSPRAALDMANCYWPPFLVASAGTIGVLFALLSDAERCGALQTMTPAKVA